MEKRICWKKGMRLTDDIMRASDEATMARIGNALILASAGRFGLLPSTRQFMLSLNLNTDFVEVQTLDCLALTRGGFLIDAQINTKYSNHLETRVPLPDHGGEQYLTIGVDPTQWEETLNGYEEPVYTFSLVGVNSPIADNAMPIAHLVYSEQTGGWHVDVEDFVPPCLFVSSHRQYEELLNQFVQKLLEVEAKIYNVLPEKTNDESPMDDVREVLRFFWPEVQQILIDTDKNRDIMTPIALLGNVQRFVAIFTAACRLDPYLKLGDSEKFRNYSFAPYNYMNVYTKIKEGLNYCFLISEKMDAITSETKPVERPKPKAKSQLAAPSIPDDKLYLDCKSSLESIPVINNAPGSTLYYSTDGSLPSKRITNGKISIKNTFQSSKTPEPDQELIVKLKAVLNDAESSISTFTVILHKNYTTGRWTKI